MSRARFRLDATTLALILCLGMGPLSTDMYLPGLPALAADFGVGAAEAQLSLSVFMIGLALGHLLFGPVSDQLGRKPVLLGGLALYAAGTLACAGAPAYGWLLAGRLAQAFGAACAIVIARAIVRDRYGAADSGRMMAYATGGMAIVAACSPASGGLLVMAFGWQAVFWTLLVVAAALALLVASRVPETLPPAHRHASGGFAGLLRSALLLGRDRAFIGYLVTGGCVYAGLFAFIAGAPYVFIDHLGISPERFGYLFTSLSLTYFVFSTLSGRLHGRIGSRGLIAIGTGLAVAGGLAMSLLAIAGVHSVAAVLVPQLLCMMGLAFTLAQCYAAALAPHPALAGTASAILGFCQMMMASAVGTAVGYAYDGSALPMAAGVGIMMLASALSFRLLVPAPRPRSPTVRETR